MRKKTNFSFYRILFLLGLVISILIPFGISSVIIGEEDEDIQGVSIRIEPEPTYNNQTAQVNASEIWITDEGNMDNVPDLYPTLNAVYCALTGCTLSGALNIEANSNQIVLDSDSIITSTITTNPSISDSSIYTLPLITSTLATLELNELFTGRKSFSSGINSSSINITGDRVVLTSDSNHPVSVISPSPLISLVDITLPSSSTTLAGYTIAQTWTAKQTFDEDIDVNQNATFDGATVTSSANTDVNFLADDVYFARQMTHYGDINTWCGFTGADEFECRQGGETGLRYDEKTGSNIDEWWIGEDFDLGHIGTTEKTGTINLTDIDIRAESLPEQSATSTSMYVCMNMTSRAFFLNETGCRA